MNNAALDRRVDKVFKDAEDTLKKIVNISNDSFKPATEEERIIHRHPELANYIARHLTDPAEAQP